MVETKTEYSSRNGAAHLDVTGALYTAEECDVFLTILRARIEGGEKMVVISLAGCPAVSSYWIGQVLSINAQLKAGGGKLTISGVRRELRSIFTAMALEQVIEFEA